MWNGLKLFEDRLEIHELIEKSPLKDSSRRLIQKFEYLKTIRKDFFLNEEDFNEILIWKLQNQQNRQSIIRQKNTAENIKLITQTAFALKHKDFNIETELKISTLCVLYGVGIPVASAILTICYPTKYAVIDYRNWQQIYLTTKKKTNYTIKEYLDYLNRIIYLSNKFKFTRQEIDLAIWTKNKQITDKKTNA